MSATDAGFLYLERSHAPLQIGALVRLSEPLPVERLIARLESRIPRAPRYAQRAVPVPFALGHPFWEDAPDFDVREHVQRWALPPPAGEYELWELAAQLIAQPLRRDRPLWEMHLLEGSHDGHATLLIKVHHCMADGLAGVRLLDALLDGAGKGSDALHEGLPRAPRRRKIAQVGRALDEGVGRPLRLLRRVAGTALHPARARDASRRMREAMRSAVLLALEEAPAMPWNARIGPRRCLYFTRLPLASVKRVCRSHGGTVNDVVVSALAGGLHRYLEAIGVSTRGLELRALVPVTLRGGEDVAALGNRISAIRVPLAVSWEDELQRLGATHAITAELKTGLAWEGLAALLELADHLPAPVVSAIGRRIGNLRVANVVATNVRGPGEPRFLCGRPVEAIDPIVPIADGLGLGLAVLSYQGVLHVGLNADPALVPDLEKLGHAIEGAFAELCARS